MDIPKVNSVAEKQDPHCVGFEVFTAVRMMMF
jgi:hypothetical protein